MVEKLPIEMESQMSNSISNDALLHKSQDAIDHIEKLIDLEWNGQITAPHCIERITAVVEKYKEVFND